MSFLAEPTAASWITAAVAQPATILVDHAHCEKKAASTAVGFLFRNPEEPRLCHAMSRLAREELLHFERVLAELKRRDIPFGRLSPSPYGAELQKLVRKDNRFTGARSCSSRGKRAEGGRERPPVDGDRKEARPAARLVDELLVCALIEARSRERFTLLAEHLPDRSLASLYDELGPSEERHAALYVELACEHADEAEVEARLRELARREAQIVAAPLPPGTPEPSVRLHAG